MLPLSVDPFTYVLMLVGRDLAFAKPYRMKLSPSEGTATFCEIYFLLFSSP